MSDDSGTPGNNQPITQSNAGGNPPSTTPPPANNPPQQHPAPNFGGLETAIKSFTDAVAALPETVARSVKEAVGTPQSSAPASNPPGQNSGGNGGTSGQSGAGGNTGGNGDSGKGTDGASSGGAANSASSVPGNRHQPTKLAKWWFS